MFRRSLIVSVMLFLSVVTSGLAQQPRKSLWKNLSETKLRWPTWLG